MDYLQSYRFVFSSRNWLTNILFAMLCSLIPAIGPIVLIGYLFETIEFLLGIRRSERDTARDDPRDALRAADYPSDAFSEQPLSVLPADPDPEPEAYPDFTFDRFSEYLTRGVWPFLVRLLLGLPVGILLSICWMIGMVGMGVAGERDSGVGVAVFFVLLALVYFVLMLLVGVVSMPLYLRAGLSGDFGSAFSMTFLRDFLKRVGKEVVLAELFMSATSSLLMVIGMLACYVGLFPAIALITFAHHHLEYQLYKLYLERGGEPVERREKPSPRPRFPEQEEPRSTNVMRPERETW